MDITEISDASHVVGQCWSWARLVPAITRFDPCSLGRIIRGKMVKERCGHVSDKENHKNLGKRIFLSQRGLLFARYTSPSDVQ